MKSVHPSWSLVSDVNHLIDHNPGASCYQTPFLARKSCNRWPKQNTALLLQQTRAFTSTDDAASPNDWPSSSKWPKWSRRRKIKDYVDEKAVWTDAWATDPPAGVLVHRSNNDKQLASQFSNSWKLRTEVGTKQSSIMFPLFSIEVPVSVLSSVEEIHYILLAYIYICIYTSLFPLLSNIQTYIF